MLTMIFVGLAIGSVYGLTAMGLVLTYRTSGILNLAHGSCYVLGACGVAVSHCPIMRFIVRTHADRSASRRHYDPCR